MTKMDNKPEKDRESRRKSIALIEDGKLEIQGFVVKRIELCEYIDRVDPQLGPYSVITAIVETDKGKVELKYDEGFRGEQALEYLSIMLKQYTGFSSLINRALIEINRMR
jgi:hypothetical protein